MASMQETSKARLGDLLLERKLVTQEQLDDAITAQKTSHQPLGEILIERKLITSRQVRRSLKWQSFARLATMVTTCTLAPAMFAQASSLAEESRRDTSMFIKTDAGMMEKLDNERFDQSLLTLDSYGMNSQSSSPRNGKKISKRWQSEVKGFIGMPMYNFLKGEYKNGADKFSEGMAYKAKWSKKGLKLEVKYQF